MSIITKVDQHKEKFYVLVADMEKEVVGVSIYYNKDSAEKFAGACHMFHEEEYDDGQGRKFDILDDELK
jgi:hypothetical protein